MASKSLSLLLSVATLVNSQDRVTIWSSTLDSNESLAEWYGTELALPGIVNAGASLCPEGDTCMVLAGVSELYRYNSTVGFHSTELSFSLQSEGMTDQSLTACEVYFITGTYSNTQTDWTIIGSYINDGTAVEHTITMPDDANDEEIVGVDFYAWGDNDTFCRLRNIELTGIEITGAPTSSPTTTADNEQCAFVYSSGAPWPVDSCYYKTPGYSYGLYCTQTFNGTNYANKKVVELLFQNADCEGGLEGWEAAGADLTNVYDCDPDDVDCNCEGLASACETVSRRSWTVVDALSYDNACSDEDYVDEVFVTNVCLSRGGLGSVGFECDDETEFGVKEMWYASTTCSGERANTPSPSTVVNKYENELCVDFSCGASAESGDEALEGAVIAVIVVVVLCCVVLLVVIMCGRHHMGKKRNDNVYFDNEAGDNETMNARETLDNDRM